MTLSPEDYMWIIEIGGYFLSLLLIAGVYELIKSERIQQCWRFRKIRKELRNGATIKEIKSGE